MKLVVIAFSAALAVVAGASCTNAGLDASVNSKVTFVSTMNGANEVPANSSGGSGTFIGTLDTLTNVFTYDITFTGLASASTAGHIHGPGAAGVIAGPAINFASLAGATFTVGATNGTAHGSTILSVGNQITSTIKGDSLKKLLFAGLTYVNLHSATNASGEIRGQIVRR